MDRASVGRANEVRVNQLVFATDYPRVDVDAPPTAPVPLGTVL